MEPTPATRIAIVDDDANARSALADLFEDIGYQVFVAQDGIEALELVARVEPDIVLTDLQMPRLDGVSLLERGRSLVPRARFIVMTAYDTPHTFDTVLRGGASGYLIKPFDLGTVERVVTAVVGSTGAATVNELVR